MLPTPHVPGKKRKRVYSPEQRARYTALERERRKKGLRPSPKSRESSRRSRLRMKYGISVEEYNGLWNKQDGRCAICLSHEDDLAKTLAVDHCHKSKKVRGLLCTRCNLAVGMILDTPEIAILMAKYIQRNRPDDQKTTAIVVFYPAQS